MTVDEFLAGEKPEPVALFRRFAELADACGDSRVDVKRTIVYWKRERIFAGAFVKGRRLEVVIDLLRAADHPCLFAAFPTTKRVVSHRLRFEEPDELDDALQALLHEAYAEVGPGTRELRARLH